MSQQEGRTGRMVIAASFATYALLLGAVSATVPYRPALDDPEVMHLAQAWADGAKLEADGLFRRVPLWPIALGSAFRVLGEAAGLFAIQASAVVLGMLCARRYCALRREPVALSWIHAPPFFVFATSPQLVLYSRHAVNELWIGALSSLVLVLALKPGTRSAIAIGVASAAAAMCKLAGAVVALPGIAALLRLRGGARSRSLLLCALGAAAVLLPLIALHVALRGGGPIDNTSAFNLSGIPLQEWLALGDHTERQRLGMERFWQLFSADPLGWLGAAVARGGHWLARPSSLDLLAFGLDYSPLWIEAADAVAFFGLAVLAVLGARVDDWPVWLVPAALLVACSFPLHTPATPRIVLLFPFLLLAPKGIESLRG